MKIEQFNELDETDWERIDNCARLVELAAQFNGATIGEGVNSGASSYGNVVNSSKILASAAYDLLEILRRADVIPRKR